MTPYEELQAQIATLEADNAAAQATIERLREASVLIGENVSFNKDN